MAQPADELTGLIRYECERCNRGFVRPRAGRHLGFTGQLHAEWIGIVRSIRYHEALGPGIGAARRGLVAGADDEAFRNFVQSVHFCQACRRFVCHECWSVSRGTCQLCAGWATSEAAGSLRPQTGTSVGVGRPVVSMVPDAPRRLRGYVPRVALVAVLVLLIIGSGLAMATFASGLASQTVASATATPVPPLDATAIPAGAEASSSIPGSNLGAGPSAGPSLSPTDAGTPASTPATGPRRTSSPTSAPTHTPTPAPTPTSSPTPTPTASPTPSPTPTPTVTPLEKPTIVCSADINDGVTTPYTLSCSITSGSYDGGDVLNWTLEGDSHGSDSTWTITDLNTYHVRLDVSRAGTDPVSSNVVPGSSGSW